MEQSQTEPTAVPAQIEQPQNDEWHYGEWHYIELHLEVPAVQIEEPQTTVAEIKARSPELG